MVGSLLVMVPAPAAPTHYVTMSDGVQIATNISCPHALDEPPIDMFGQVPPNATMNCPGGGQYPTILQISGYDTGSATGRTLLGELHDRFGPSFPDPPLADDSRQITYPYTPNYVTIEASVRGTGCSGGEFDLFSSRSSLDGYELIEWIAGQPFSNGEVALVGHSYSGLTATLIAATQPPSLKAMSVSGLIDDLYRGIVYPGGVSNYGFPLYWTGAIRPLYDVGGGTMPGLLRPLDSPEPSGRVACAGNVITHRKTVLNDPIVQGLSDLDNDWWRARSLISYIDRISVPIHITGAYQDEQTGARGPAHLWEKVTGVPKRLVLTNGNHGTNTNPAEVRDDRVNWVNHWMGVTVDNTTYGVLSDDKKSVSVFLEMHNHSIHDPASGTHGNGRIDAADFPLPATTFTDYYLRAGGGLSTTAPDAETADTYFSGSQRQSWVELVPGSPVPTGPFPDPGDNNFGHEVTQANAPDELRYVSAPVTSNTAIVGPITATLFLSTTGNDTELYVELFDVDSSDGSITFLQRGLLKASHRAIDVLHSDTTAGGAIYRPFRPHTTTADVLPTAVVEYLVEVWPVGHVFRTGHSIGVRITAPPAVDGIYSYIPKRPVGLNTLYHDSLDPNNLRQSRLMLPIVPLTGVTLGPEIPCGGQTAVRCI